MNTPTSSPERDLYCDPEPAHPTTTSLVVYTSGASAVRTCCQSGWHRIWIDLTTWSEPERDMLARWVCDTNKGAKVRRPGLSMNGSDLFPEHALDVAPPTAARLLEIVRAYIVMVDAKIAEVASVARKEIEDARTAPIASLRVHQGDENKLRVLDEVASFYGLADVEIKTAREMAGTDAYGYVALRDLGRADEYTEYLERLVSAKKAEADAWREECRVGLLQLLEQINPALLPRARDGVLPKSELGDALLTLLTPVLDAAGPSLGPVTFEVPGDEPTEMTKAEHAAYRAACAEAERLRLKIPGIEQGPTVTLHVHEADDGIRYGVIHVGIDIFGASVPLAERWVTRERALGVRS